MKNEFTISTEEYIQEYEEYDKAREQLLALYSGKKTNKTDPEIKNKTSDDNSYHLSKSSEFPHDFLIEDRVIEANRQYPSETDNLHPQLKVIQPPSSSKGILLTEKISEISFDNLNNLANKNDTLLFKEKKSLPIETLSQDNISETDNRFLDKLTTSSPKQKINENSIPEVKETKIKNIDFYIYEKLIEIHKFKCFEGELYIYDNQLGCYSLLNERQLKVIIRSGWERSIEQQLTKFKVDDVIDRLKSNKNIQINDNSFDSQTSYINFLNGVYSITEQRLLTHSPKYNFTNYINACYKRNDPKGQTFTNFLTQCTNGEKEKILMLQEIIGYIISNYTTAKKFFVFIGKPHTGKSTILDVLKEIIGGQYTSAIPLHRLGERFMKARLSKVKLNISGEINDGILKDLDTIKSLTGNDEIEAEFKGKDSFSFKNKARLAFAGNNMPLLKSADHSSAFFDRMVISIFNNTVPAHERDYYLKEKLLAERDYIVSWAVEGLLRLINNNFIFTECKESKQFKMQYIKEMNTVPNFLETCCSIDKDNEELKTHKRDLYSFYIKFCKDNCYTALNKYEFFNELKKLDLKKVKFRINGSTPLEGFKGITLIK
ncbi:phage/plasmid primase, P4 family [Bacillus sp. MUM 13]|uniref:DNA primase family protein n=1 Tax=Bacillus sp. MUM 13 TaxID=1678001 RepID=UPI0008F5D4B0|nr:phage/plasmid primase, P4 family [Bacillus sp. MUM 13]OIK10238.1 hypothetical protein BIV59_14715 [Bacillus sp. MUM 13]